MRRILLFVLLMFGCTEDLDLDMSKITERDQLGEIIGLADPTDWRLDDKWSKEEESHFNLPDYLQKKYKTIISDSIAVKPITGAIYAYPNPFNGTVVLNMPVSNAIYAVRMIDKNKKVYLGFDFLTVSSLLIDIKETEVGEFFRIYYKIYDGKTIYRGHGDILRQ